MQRLSAVISILLCFATLSACDSPGAATEDRGAFEALAGVTVHIQDRQAELLSVLEQYSEKNHLRVVVKDLLPRNGRKVLQIQMYLSDRSHFYGDNFLDATKFSLHAYSHERESVWRDKWSALISGLVDTFGKENVELSDPR